MVKRDKLGRFVKTIDRTIMVSCKCGCGQLRPKYDKKGRERKYIKGHIDSVWNIGRKHTEAWKKERSKFGIEWHKENKGTKKYKEIYEKISKVLLTKKEIKCNYCGKLHLKQIKNIKKNNYCSHKCYSNDRKEKYSGEKSPRWQGGKSFEPYDKSFNDKFKREIRKRDNQVCMLCGIHREKLKRALDVHHVNYDKLLSILQNCISLCSSCHTKTNNNRKHWIKFFQELLSEKYGYKYSENKVVLDYVNFQ